MISLLLCQDIEDLCEIATLFRQEALPAACQRKGACTAVAQLIERLLQDTQVGVVFLSVLRTLLRRLTNHSCSLGTLSSRWRL